MADVDKDPVCGMIVGKPAIETTFAEIRYVFCSDQCHERFVANPHLYIGFPGHKAPGQRNMQLLKRRRFKLEQPLTTLESELLTRDLCGMMGIREVHLDGPVIEVIYDLMQVTAEQIEAHLAGIGLRLGGEWSERLRRAFIHFLEESEVSGTEEPPWV